MKDWIKISERIPDNDRDVIIACRSGAAFQTSPRNLLRGVWF